MKQLALFLILVQWALLQNDFEPGIALTRWELTNNTTDTLTYDGGWKIGYCHMSARPVITEAAEFDDHEVCATYHELTPTELFTPLAPGETRTWEMQHRGRVMQYNNAPEAMFFVAPDGSTTPIQLTIDTADLRLRQYGPGYATGEWLFAYNEPFTRPIPPKENISGEQEPWVRPLDIVPCPKSVEKQRGVANLNAPIQRKQLKKGKAEAYRLTLGAQKITIEASDEAGYFYAEQTLQRLRENNETLPCMVIEDAPDLPHRGLMIDIARNYTRPEQLHKLLQVMAAYKLNVLHLHLADDEAWRLEIPGLPELTEVGARRGYTTDEQDCLYPAYGGQANGYLSTSDYIALVRCADSLHIQVIPEIDMPGHSRAAIRAMEARYMRLIDAQPDSAEQYRLIDPDDQSEYTSAQYYTDNILCIARPSCYTFIEHVIHALADMHNQAGQPLSIMHIGGDEVPKGAWKKSPMAKQLMQQEGLADTYALKDYFLTRVIAILQPLGIQPAGWEDILFRGDKVNPAFADKSVLSWCWNNLPESRGDEKPYLLANAGYPVVLACVGNLYLDMAYTRHYQEQGLRWGGYTDEHTTFDFLPFDIYRSVRWTLLRSKRDIHTYDAGQRVRLQADKHTYIHGINAQLFAETIRSDKQLWQYLFPKLIGVAERAWNAIPISYRAAAETDKAQAISLGRQAFEVERLLFSNQLYRFELPRIHDWGLPFHLPLPGIHVQQERIGAFYQAGRNTSETRMVLMNTPVPESVIRYTTDGSEPTPQSKAYQMPFILQQGDTIRAKIFYLGEASHTTDLSE